MSLVLRNSAHSHSNAHYLLLCLGHLESEQKANTNLYSLIKKARATDLEPYIYLKKIITELPKATNIEDIETLE